MHPCENIFMQPRKTPICSPVKHLYFSSEDIFMHPRKHWFAAQKKKHIYAIKTSICSPVKTSLLHPKAFADCLIILCHLSRSFLHSPLCVNFFAEIRDGFSALCRFVSREHCRSFTILSFYEKYDHALSRIFYLLTFQVMMSFMNIPFITLSSSCEYKHQHLHLFHHHLHHWYDLPTLPCEWFHFPRHKRD